jgi:lysophospholipase L1-like esterase
MQTSLRSRMGIATVAFFTAMGLTLGGSAQAKKPSWVVAWASSMQGLAQNATPTNATIRMVARPSIGGDSVRIRLENTFGTVPVTIGAASVGLRARLSALVDGSSMELTFDGSPSVTIPAGGKVMSDQVKLRVEAWQDIAVSLYLPGTNVPVTAHNGAVTTSYLTPSDAGNHVADSGNGVFTVTTTSMYFLSSVEVFTSAAQGAIVAFGDSITDGTCSTLDAHDRWEDVLALRLLLERGTGWAVVNEGIGGNTVTRKDIVPPPASPPGIERLDRDVLEHSGVTHVVVFEATNDIRRGVSADAVIAGLQDIVSRVKAAKLKVIGVTVIPRQGSMGWDPAMTATRNKVNDWIRQHAGFDAVIDFDKVVWNPADHEVISPAYNCGDSVHPNPFGYLAMGRSIDLKLFR